MECIKVKIDRAKCENYKTFQPELPTRKFLFSKEKISMHNLKLLCEDSRDQNKATTFYSDREHKEESKVEKSEVEKPEVEKPEVEKSELEKPENLVRQAITGMFRDNIKRIDLVLVVEDNGIEPIDNIKMEFISYILRAGLEVELEPVVMKSHKNLSFLKIHAPDTVLKKYGKFFGTKRYFADTRYVYMDTEKKKTKNYEKEWVMFVRNNYMKPYEYSNYERSIIVYKMLLHLSFGDNANSYGIERLLNRKVIVDVFALHDGPYFITPDQTISGSNARQILNYYWSRKQNVFQQQPIHLIHEYFGPRLAFYFAFYEFFIKALKVAAVVGVFNIILGVGNLTILEKDIKKSCCGSNYLMCKSCAIQPLCPIREFKEYCLSIKIHLILDHMFVPLYSIFTVLGTFIFLRLWQRREYFLKWMWEVGRQDSYYKNAIRPLFDSGFGARTDPFIGGLKYSESRIPIFFRNFISKVIVIFYWYILVPIMYNSYDLYESFCSGDIDAPNKEKYMNYIEMSAFQTLYILVITGFEKIYHYIIYFIVKYENHSSHKKMDKSIIIKKNGFKFVFQYALIAYYAWLHGRHARYKLCSAPHTSLNTYSDFMTYMMVMYGSKEKDVCDFYKYCSPYSCIIEISIMLATLLVVTQVGYKLYDYIFCLRTDYNQSIYNNSDIPCWEREYRLSTWTEEDIVQKYVNLAAQATLVTWFVIAFPLAPLVLYLVNVWHMRHEARKLLLASRRPLLIKTPGTKITKVFYFIASVAVLTNALNIALTTRSVLRYMMTKLKVESKQLFDFTHYHYEKDSCYAPDLLQNDPKSAFYYFADDVNKFFFKADYYMLSVYRFYQIILFVFAMGFAFLIIRYKIPRQPEVEIARATEEKIRNLYYLYEYEYS